MSNKTKIIYIDDEQINVKLFQINFSDDFKVHGGFSGYDGLDLLNKYPETKVVLCDMKMPEMNGIEFIKKANEKFPAKKYIIITGFEITEDIQTALDSGLIHNYFRKPFKMQDIKKAINELC